MTILQVCELAKSVNGAAFPIIADISLDVREGEIVCVLGASGCGKTTLLRILAGLDEPSAGRITCRESRPGQGIGYLPQGERLYEWRDVVSNVAISGELLGWRGAIAKDRARELLDTLGLGEFLSARAEELSGGMIQRALLARTLLTEPNLLLLDEPLGQLDLVARRALAEKIRGYVKERQAGAVIVSHSVEEVVALADKVLILSARPSTVARSLVELRRRAVS
jgi:NitT/TauT family transport system ATP-binding protein